jgi:hypothetical protein
MSDKIIIYTDQDELVNLTITLEKDTLWLNLNQIAELFQRDKSVISKHLKNIFEEEELVQEATVANFATVQTEGKRDVERLIEHYNLDAILSVGYRVNSKQGTKFRIWATLGDQVLITHEEHDLDGETYGNILCYLVAEDRNTGTSVSGESVKEEL